MITVPKISGNRTTKIGFSFMIVNKYADSALYKKSTTNTYDVISFVYLMSKYPMIRPW